VPTQVRILPSPQRVNSRSFTRCRDIPIGGAGPHTRATHAELVRTKFRTHGGPIEVADAFASMSTCSADELARLLPLVIGN
jgi:hypothetical protein